MLKYSWQKVHHATSNPNGNLSSYFDRSTLLSRFSIAGVGVEGPDTVLQTNACPVICSMGIDLLHKNLAKPLITRHELTVVREGGMKGVQRPGYIRIHPSSCKDKGQIKYTTISHTHAPQAFLAAKRQTRDSAYKFYYLSL